MGLPDQRLQICILLTRNNLLCRKTKKCEPTWPRVQRAGSSSYPKNSHYKTKLCSRGRMQTWLQPVRSIVFTGWQPAIFFYRRWNEKYEWSENEREDLESGEFWWNDNGETGEPWAKSKNFNLVQYKYHSASIHIKRTSRNYMKGYPHLATFDFVWSK